ncbi:Z1 domain-containing protein [Lactobacillus delbrueckii subsp. lactis]|uniref:Z1 domain-containing protein n=1 Tax=Lactobacillus delbrueckii TaxID=1584 RepID=UPI001E356225|nr:Z1 domain-containing protein [Lactobacillus delbrueckii]MCD5442418.1 Z1 domain-containing protein [Lactobacillus delbrueckii subsp. lactis]
MGYLDNYIDKIRNEGKTGFADSIEKTAKQIGEKRLSQFDYASHQMGLLFGNIQSGKTGHVFGVMCEAVDLGFPFFLFLTTDNTTLQEQTYDRAKNDLTDFVVCNENEEQKFRNHGDKPVVIVVKKNYRVLKAWANRFRNTNMLLGNPLFIIDDEADAASLNTKVNQGKVSSINKYLQDIIDTAQSSIYLQMTGTPQSLLLQSSISGWHPLFVDYFEPGNAYLGGNFFFPKDKTPDFVRFIDSEPASNLARDVVIRHLVVTAQLFLTGHEVSNCLIHTSRLQSEHNRTAREISNVLDELSESSDDPKLKAEMKKEYDTLAPVKDPKQSFEDIYQLVQKILSKKEFNIVKLNGSSADTSEDYANGCNFIVGGTNLGRGVTFSQLHTFYYARTSKHPQADTMWQHNRMFGYDRDKGLISLFITHELYNLFSEINETNNAIVEQARKGEKITISYPDGLNPTRENVLDKSLLNILPGNSNHFPSNPHNNTFDEISKMVEKFDGTEAPQEVTLNLIIKILDKFEDDNFNFAGYKSMIQSEMHKASLATGMLMVRRNRNITYGMRALLSPNDWAATNAFTDKFVLTLYQVNGDNPELNWPEGKKLWVPNIKLPGTSNIYMID